MWIIAGFFVFYVNKQFLWFKKLLVRKNKQSGNVQNVPFSVNLHANWLIKKITATVVVARNKWLCRFKRICLIGYQTFWFNFINFLSISRLIASAQLTITLHTHTSVSVVCLQVFNIIPSSLSLQFQHQRSCTTSDLDITHLQRKKGEEVPTESKHHWKHLLFCPVGAACKAAIIHPNNRVPVSDSGPRCVCIQSRKRMAWL